MAQAQAAGVSVWPLRTAHDAQVAQVCWVRTPTAAAATAPSSLDTRTLGRRRAISVASCRGATPRLILPIGRLEIAFEQRREVVIVATAASRGRHARRGAAAPRRTAATTAARPCAPI